MTKYQLFNLVCFMQLTAGGHHPSYLEEKYKVAKSGALWGALDSHNQSKVLVYFEKWNLLKEAKEMQAECQDDYMNMPEEEYRLKWRI